MHSTSKFNVSRQELSRIVDDHDLGAVVQARELTGGWFNTIYRVDRAGDAPVVIKFAPPPDHLVMRYEHGLLETEVEVLSLLATEGIPVPRVLAQGETYFIMEHVPGESLSAAAGTVSRAEREVLDAEFGVLSARINTITGPRFGRFRDDHCASDSWSGAFTEMVEDLLCDAADTGVALPIAPQTVRQYGEVYRAELCEVREPRLVLWDLHPGNVLVENGRIAAVIDCDRALWGDPNMEYAFRSSAQTSDEFRTGYAESAGGGDAREHTLNWLYDLYLGLVMVVECSFRGYAPDHVAWAKARLEDVIRSFDR